MDDATFNNDHRYDLQVKYHQQLESANEAERRLAALLVKKFELKTETWQWRRTGKIAVEYARHGRPSCLGSTEAEMWAHEIRDDAGVTLAYVIADMKRWKELCAVAYRRGWRARGGDGGASDMVLLPVNLNTWLGPPPDRRRAVWVPR